MLSTIRSQARELRKQTYALYLAYRDPRTPWYAKAFAALVVAYALSPVDLIPDFIPVLGYLDDLVIVPAGIFVALRLIPPEVMRQARDNAAAAEREGRINSRAGLVIVAATWAVCAALLAFFIYRIVE